MPAPMRAIASPHSTKSMPSPSPASSGSSTLRRAVPRRRSSHTSTASTGRENRHRQNALVLPLVPDTLMKTDDRATQKLPATASSTGFTFGRDGATGAGRASVVVTRSAWVAETIKDKRMFLSGFR